MSLTKFVSNYASFNEWANHRIVAWLETLDKELLYAETPSSYTSIDYTLQHILRAQTFWQLFITEDDTSGFDWSVRHQAADHSMEELKDISTQMKLAFSAFSEAELLKPLHFEERWAKNDLSRYDCIVHIINHSTFHRGQIVTIARVIGIRDGIVNTDYNKFIIR